MLDRDVDLLDMEAMMVESQFRSRGPMGTADLSG